MPDVLEPPPGFVPVANSASPPPGFVPVGAVSTSTPPPGFVPASDIRLSNPTQSKVLSMENLRNWGTYLGQTPLVRVPRATVPEWLPNGSPGAAGFYNSLAQQVEGLTTPANAAMVAGSAGESVLAQFIRPLLVSIFGTKMATEAVPEAAGKASVNLLPPLPGGYGGVAGQVSPEVKGETAGDLLGSTVLAGLMGREATPVGSLKPHVEPKGPVSDVVRTPLEKYQGYPPVPPERQLLDPKTAEQGRIDAVNQAMNEAIRQANLGTVETAGRDVSPKPMPQTAGERVPAERQLQPPTGFIVPPGGPAVGADVLTEKEQRTLSHEASIQQPWTGLISAAGQVEGFNPQLAEALRAQADKLARVVQPTEDAVPSSPQAVQTLGAATALGEQKAQSSPEQINQVMGIDQPQSKVGKTAPDTVFSETWESELKKAHRRQGLGDYYVSFQGKKFAVDSPEDAAQRFQQFKQRTGMGDRLLKMEGLWDMPVTDKTGKLQGVIDKDGQFRPLAPEVPKGPKQITEMAGAEQIVPISERLRQRLMEHQKRFEDRIKKGESLSRLDAGLFEDVVSLGKLAYDSAKDFAKWSGEMVRQLGENVKPHLQEVWNEVKGVAETRPQGVPLLSNAGEIVAQPSRLRMGTDKNGQYDAGQAVARLRNTLGETSAEWQILKDQGILDKHKPGQKITPAELRKSVEEMSPRVEVRKYEQGGPQTETNARLAQIQHELDTLSSGDALLWERVPERIRNRDRIVALRDEGLRLQQKFEEKSTTKWQGISPVPEDQMRGYTEILVKKPLGIIKQSEQSDSLNYRQIEREQGVQFPAHPHFPNDPNVLAFTRGFMEIRPDGKKVWHMVEAQSDWEQQQREYREVVKKNEKSGMKRGIADFEDKSDSEDPLLAHYERLALKAAIEHAKEQGADSVVVHDAETAMMTEGHDRAAEWRIPPTENNIKLLEQQGELSAAKKLKAGESTDIGFQPGEVKTREEYIAQLHKEGFELERKPSQEPGMRLHYDRNYSLVDRKGNRLSPESFPDAESATAFAKNRTAGLGLKTGEFEVQRGSLHEIASELTGEKGTRFEGGEHKMAFTDREDNAGYEMSTAEGGQVREPRKGLIFETSPGVKKIHISGTEFDLTKSKQSGKVNPPTVLGKDRPVEVKPGEVRGRLGPKGLGTKAALEKNQGEAGSVRVPTREDVAKGVEEAKEALKKQWAKFKYKKQVYQEVLSAKHRENVAKLSAHRDAADDAAMLVGEKAGNHIQAVASAVFGKGVGTKAQSSVLPMLEAGTKAKLESEGARVKGKHGKFDEAVQFALTNWDKIQPVIQAVKEQDAQNVKAAKDAGLEIEPIKDYLKRVYEREDSGMSRSTMPRQYDTVFDAVADGKKPKLDAQALVERRTEEIYRRINQKAWAESGKGIKSTDGLPLAVELDDRNNAPNGYTKLEGFNMAVLKGYGHIFQALTRSSVVRDNPWGKAALELAGGVKHGTLAWDSYHASKITNFRLSLGLNGSIYQDGLAILTHSARDLEQAVKDGRAPESALEYQKMVHDLPQGKFNYRKALEIGVQEGLRVGRHSEALYTRFVREMPVVRTIIGGPNKFIFEKLSRGAMVEAYQLELGRIAKMYPEKSIKDVSRMVSKDLNTRFGNLGRQGLIKEATFQDLATLVLLAPKWFEASAMSEIGAASQVVKAPFNKGRVGTLGKSAGGLIAFYLVLTQAVNMILNGGKTTFQNENSKGHELDLWIPPHDPKKRGLWFSPLAVPMELTHDIVRYMRGAEGVDTTSGKLKSLKESGQKIIDNKLSSMGRGLKEFYTGEDWRGGQLQGWDWLTSPMETAVNPTPLLLRGAATSKKEGDWTPFKRQAMASAGMKAEPETYQEMRERRKALLPDKSVAGRAGLEKELKAERPLTSDNISFKGLEKRLEKNLATKEALRKSLEPEIQKWMEKNNLHLTGFVPEINVKQIGEKGVKVPLTDIEQNRYKEILTEQYNEILKSWTGQPLDQKHLDSKLLMARNRAKKQLQSEIESDSIIESHKESERKSIVPRK